MKSTWLVFTTALSSLVTCVFAFPANIIPSIQSMMEKELVPSYCDLIFAGGYSLTEIEETSVLITGATNPNEVLENVLRAHSPCSTAILEHKSLNFDHLRSIVDLLQATRYSQIVLYGQMLAEFVHIPEDVRKEVIYLQIEDSLETQVSIWQFCPSNATVGSEFGFIGRWTLESGIIRSLLPYKKCTPYFLTKEVHQVHYFDIAPGAMRPYYPGGDAAGIEPGMLNILGEFYGIKFEYNEIREIAGSFGEYEYVKKVLDGDFAVGFQCNSGDLTTYVDLLTTYVTMDNRWIYRTPIPLSNFTRILIVFDPVVWAVMYFIFAIFAIVLGLFYYMYKKIDSEDNKKMLRSHNMDVADIIITVFAKFTEPDAIPWFHRNTAASVVVIFWSVYCWFIIMFFTSNLRVNLIARTYENLVNTKQDVLDRDTRVMISIEYDEVRQYAETDELVRKIYDRAVEGDGIFITNSDSIYTFLEEVKHVGAVGIATHEIALYTYFLSSEFGGLQNLKLASETLFYTHCGVATMKKFPWKEEFDWVILRLLEGGISHKLLYEPLPIQATIPWTKEQDLSNLSALEPSHIGLISFFWIGGMVIAFISFLVENSCCQVWGHNQSSAIEDT